VTGRRVRLALVLVAGIALGALLGDHLRPARREEAVSGPSVRVPVAQDGRAFADDIAASRRNAIVRAVEAVEPAVVSVNTFFVQERPVRFRDPFFDFFYPLAVLRQKVPGIGSGFIVREDGLVLTNAHVVEGAVSISVTLPDRRKFEVKDIGNQVLMDPESDVALIRLSGARGLPTVRLGDSDDVIIGEWAIAIGNPFGLDIGDSQPTVTVGVVSARDRDFRSQEDGRSSRTYKKMIQTDAAINRGNSGGPLVNGAGEVIGINTFIFTEGGGGSIGVGFAIPSNKARRVMEELLRYGRTREFWTGISVMRMTPWVATSLGLGSTEGALISAVEGDSPGRRAGLRPGDVIVEVNGKPIRDDEDALNAFQGGSVGEVFQVTVLRNGRRMQVRLVLEQDPGRG
jgi:serine protease Do